MLDITSLLPPCRPSLKVAVSYVTDMKWLITSFGINFVEQKLERRISILPNNSIK